MPPSAREFFDVLSFLLVTALWISGCGDSELRLDPLPSCPSSSICITIKDVNFDNPGAHFEPMQARVSAGTTVFWSYNGSQIHDLTFITVNQQGNSTLSTDPTCSPHVEISYHCSKILDPGTYQFFCSLHPFTAAGKLIVKNQ